MKGHLRFGVVFILFLWVSFAVKTTAQQAAWTIMVYLDADNDLEDAAIDDVNEMEWVGSTDSVNIIVQFDRIDGYDATNGDWTDTRRFRITQDGNGLQITSPMLENVGELNMGDPETLTDFIEWATDEFPADHYALILWNHGGGWYKSFPGSGIKKDPPPDKDVCYDYTSGDYLDNMEVAAAIDSAGIHLDILAYDACLMGMIEVAYQGRHHADIIIGSEALEPWDGYDYTGFLADLVSYPSMTPDSLSSGIVYYFGEEYTDWVTLSAFYTSGVEQIAVALDSLAADLLNRNPEWEAVSLAWNNAQRFDEPNYVDIGSFARELAEELSDTLHIRHAQDLALAVDEARVAIFECKDYPEATGLTIYFPPEQSYDTEYEESGRDFADSTLWVPFLTTFHEEYFVDDTEPNDHFATAYPAGTITGNKGRLSDSCDIDIYHVFYGGDVPDESYVSLLPPADIDMYLFRVADTSIIPIDSSVHSGLSEEMISFEGLDTGYYYIVLYPKQTSPDLYTLTWSGMQLYGGYDYMYGTPMTMVFDDGDPSDSFSGGPVENGIGMSFLINGYIDGVWYYVTQMNDEVSEGDVKLHLYYADNKFPLSGYTPAKLEPDGPGWNFLDLSEQGLIQFGEKLIFGLAWSGENTMAIGVDSLYAYGDAFLLLYGLGWTSLTDSMMAFIRPVTHYPPAIPTYCHCEGLIEMTDPSGSFDDGSGDANYENNCSCRWLIRPENADRIVLTIDTLDLEPGFDFLSVYDGENIRDGELLGTYDGIVSHETLTAESGTMFIRFRTDGSVTFPGWKVSYITEYDNVEFITGDAGSSWKLYPNPGDGVIYLERMDHKGSVAHVSYFNCVGELLGEVIIHPHQEHARIDLSRWPAGLYYIRLNQSGESAIFPYIREEK